MNTLLRTTLATLLLAVLAHPADSPAPLSDADKLTYLRAALTQARAEAAQAVAIVKFYDAEKATQQAGQQLTATIQKLKGDTRKDCQIDDTALAWVCPPVPAVSPPAPESRHDK